MDILSQKAQYVYAPHKVVMTKANGYWYALIADEYHPLNPGNILLSVLRFRNGLNSVDDSIDGWNFTNTALGIPEAGQMTSFNLTRVNGQNYLLGVDLGDNKLLRIAISNDFTEAKATDLGNPGNLFDAPRDISLTDDCDFIRAFVMNHLNISMTILDFPDGLLGPINASMKSLTGLVNPHAVSPIFRVDSDAIAIVCDRTLGELVKLRFTPDLTMHVNIPTPSPTVVNPPSYSYDSASRYYVSLTVNADLSNTVCHGVDVVNKPATPFIQNPLVCYNDPLKLTSYDYPGITYTWILPDSSISHEQYPRVTQEGTYQVQLSYGGCYSDQSNFNVLISPNPNVTILPGIDTICSSHPINLSGKTSGGTPPYIQYRWNADQSIVFNSDTSSSTIVSQGTVSFQDTVNLSDIPWFYASKNVKRNTNVDNQTLTVNDVTYFNGLGTGSEDTMIYILNKQYSGFSFMHGIDEQQFDCGKSGFLVIGDKSVLFNSGIIDYYALTQTINLNVSGIDTLKLITYDNGNYQTCNYADWLDPKVTGNFAHVNNNIYFSVTDSIGCKTTDSSLIVIDTSRIRILMTSAPVIQCEGTAFELSVQADYKNNISYQWQILQGSNWVNVNNDAYYSGVLTASLTVGNSQPFHSGSYRCRMQALLCQDTTSGTINVIINSIPVVLSVAVTPEIDCLTPNGSISVTITGGEGVAQYSLGGTVWQTNPDFKQLDSGTYKIYTKNGDGSCPDSANNVFVKYQCENIINFNVCNNVDSFNLNNAIPIAATGGTWSDSTITGYRNNNYFLISQLPAEDYTFFYKVDSMEYLVTINLHNSEKAGIPVNIYSCNKKINLFSALKDNSYSMTGNWFNMKQDLVDSNVILLPGVNNYEYIVSVSGYCPSDTAFVTILADSISPKIDCSMMDSLPVILTRGLDIYAFTNNDYSPVASDNCEVNTIVNSLTGDSTLENKKIDPGTYHIIWTATDDLGNKSTCVSKLTIVDLAIPNLFTPNGDGKNDTWDFDVEQQFPEAIVEIYNRWGELVYVSEKGYKQKWDGRSRSGEEQISDGYFYVIKNNDKVICKGSVTIMR